MSVRLLLARMEPDEGSCHGRSSARSSDSDEDARFRAADRRGPGRRQDLRHRQGRGARAARGRPRRPRAARWSRSWARAGRGKTTLLNCLSGLDAIDGGDVLIEGVVARAMSDRERTDYRARRMGFVFQFYNLMPVLTRGRERRAAAARRPRARRRRRAGGRSRRSSWSASPTAPTTFPTSCPAASASASTIARALVNDPAIVWADEPTGDLDSENADEIVALMRRLNRERGLTFLIVTHDIGVGRATDRIVRMLDGRDRRRAAPGGDVMCRARHAARDRHRAHRASTTRSSVRGVRAPDAARAGRLRGLLRPARRRRARRS